MDPTYSISLASDRNQWRGIVKTAKDLNGLFWSEKEIRKEDMEQKFSSNYNFSQIRR